jgi:hypothetical protein
MRNYAIYTTRQKRKALISSCNVVMTSPLLVRSRISATVGMRAKCGFIKAPVCARMSSFDAHEWKSDCALLCLGISAHRALHQAYQLTALHKIKYTLWPQSSAQYVSCRLGTRSWVPVKNVIFHAQLLVSNSNILPLTFCD